ncbi:hypothetical protein H0H93_009336 [Arthromyces matolae]|nr:hypothetical protein H0H93_009336 [Arthromyces matolae]
MDPLLPFMAHIDFVTLVNNSFESEGYINGVWASTDNDEPRILSHHFRNDIRNGSKSLSPEVKSDGFSDYLLTGNVYTPAPILPNFPNHQTLTRNLHLIYEGKMAKATQKKANWDKPLEQIIDYGKALLKNRETCYFIIGIGKEVKFWKFNKNDGFNCFVQAMYVGKNDVVKFDGSVFQHKDLRPQSEPLSIIDHGADVKLLLDAVV